jgi:hypothetical protein
MMACVCCSLSGCQAPALCQCSPGGDAQSHSATTAAPSSSLPGGGASPILPWSIKTLGRLGIYAEVVQRDPDNWCMLAPRDLLRLVDAIAIGETLAHAIERNDQEAKVAALVQWRRRIQASPIGETTE